MPTLLVRHALLNRLPPPSLQHRLHGLDDEEEDRSGDRDELDHVGDERAVAEDRLVDRERQAAEVGLADDHRHDRHDEIVNERVDDRRERDAHDERDGELDDVAAKQEVPELPEHCSSLRRLPLSRRFSPPSGCEDRGARRIRRPRQSCAPPSGSLPPRPAPRPLAVCSLWSGTHGELPGVAPYGLVHRDRERAAGRCSRHSRTRRGTRRTGTSGPSLCAAASIRSFTRRKSASF